MIWKAYAWAMLALALVTLIGRSALYFKRPETIGWWDLFEAVSRTFWEAVVPLAWMGILYGVISPTHRRLAREKGMKVAAAAAGGSLALNLPGMLAVT